MVKFLYSGGGGCRVCGASRNGREYGDVGADTRRDRDGGSLRQVDE